MPRLCPRSVLNGELKPENKSNLAHGSFAKLTCHPGFVVRIAQELPQRVPKAYHKLDLFCKHDSETKDNQWIGKDDGLIVSSCEQGKHDLIQFIPKPNQLL